MPEIKRRTPTGAAVLRQDLTESIVEAVLDELAAKGYQSLSMDAVARRAGVGKSALYRRWPSKLEMTVSTFAELGVPMASIPDTGSFRGDLRAVLDAVLDWLGDPRIGPIFTDLLGVARTNASLARGLTDDIAAPAAPWATRSSTEPSPAAKSPRTSTANWPWTSSPPRSSGASTPAANRSPRSTWTRLPT